jgi:pimeloyl-ACP methyl ester carboxylesterase
MPEVTVNGFAVPYQRQGAGEPLLALHAEDAAGQWRAFHEALSLKLDVVLPEHPGFGEAERPEWLDGIIDLAYCHLEVLDSLGLDRVHLLGESLGAWVAAEMAALAPERFRSLTLIGPLGLDVPGMPDVFVMNRARWQEITRFQPPEPEVEPPSIDQLVKESRVQATLARVGWNPYLHDPRLPRWLHRATMPALVIWGREDRLIPSSVAGGWSELLPSCRVEVVDKAGHFPALEQPDRTAALVLDVVTSAK